MKLNVRSSLYDDIRIPIPSTTTGPPRVMACDAIHSDTSMSAHPTTPRVLWFMLPPRCT